MDNTFKLTVNDVIKRPNFHKAEVVAGDKGLEAIIRWVHILEVTEIGHLLNGHELILTTGVGWKENQKLSLSLLQQMIDKKVSGLCIELGTYVNEIPKAMIELANLHDFPIIVFHEEVRFIDITQDLNGLFIESHNQMMIKLEAISNQFNKLLLSTNGFKKILRLLHQSLDVQVVYLPQDGKPDYYPTLNKSNAKEVLEQIQLAKPQSVTNSTAKSALKPVEALGIKFADLIIVSKQLELAELDYLVLDRAATALSQDQLRLLYVEEKQKHEKNQWVHEWINGEHDKSSIHQYLLELDPTIEINGCVLCIYEPNSADEETDLTYNSMLFSSIFKRQGYYPLVSFERNNLLFVLVNNRSINDWKDRLSIALKKIDEISVQNKSARKKANFGVGKLYGVEDIYKSFEQAKQTLYVNKKGLASVSFYEDLYIYRLILQLKKNNYLEEYVNDYLKPVINFDKSKNSEMFETLKVLFEVNGSRKDAADQLFIVRQTLYHRIDKLKELLGEDFMEGDKRLAIEFAVHAKSFID